MRVVILTPRRADDGIRDEIWTWLKPRLEWPVIEGHHDGEPFSRAAARNDAARSAWDVAIFCDADCYVPPAQLEAAAERAWTTGQITMAFDRFNYLSPEGTRQILDGYEGDWMPFVLEEESGDWGNSPCAVRRDLWGLVDGYDERFIGWGHEDNAFRLACEAMGGGSQRIPGPLFHLWHPHDVRESSPTFRDNCELYLEYEAAKADGRMAELLGARPCVQNA